LKNERVDIFTAVKIQVEVFRTVTPCSVVVGYRRFGGTCSLCLQCCLLLVKEQYSSLHRWVGDSKFRRNVGILPQPCTASQPRRPWLQSSPPWRPQILHRHSSLSEKTAEICM